MRWEYTEPEEKLFVSSAEGSWFYLPEDEMVYRMPLSGKAARRVPSRLLAGDQAVAEDFEAVEVEELSGERETTLRLSLRPRQMDEAVDSLVRGLLASDPGDRLPLEASGGVTLENVRELAETGVHRISIGALTHSAPNADVALEVTPGDVARA